MENNENNEKVVPLAGASGMKFTITVGKNRFSKDWQPEEFSWDQFAKRLKHPRKIKETMSEYLALPKDAQDNKKDGGGFVGGRLNGTTRKSGNVIDRSLVTLDLDNIPDGVTADEIIKKVINMRCHAAFYTTMKHTPDSPRLRIIFLLSEPCTREEYEPIARKIAEQIGMEYMDPTTFEASRLMYWPSVTCDGKYSYRLTEGRILKAADILAMYPDWKDVRQWPLCPNEREKHENTGKKRQDPLGIAGIVGDFCRAYNIYEAIEKFIPDKYILTDDPDRMTYALGSTSCGAEIYDDGLFIFSHHSTDPCCEKLVNAFDLVRIHLFGDQDTEEDLKKPITDRPSFRFMAELASKDELVVKSEDDAMREAFMPIEVPAESAQTASPAEAAPEDDPYSVMTREQLLTPEVFEQYNADEGGTTKAMILRRADELKCRGEFTESGIAYNSGKNTAQKLECPPEMLQGVSLSNISQVWTITKDGIWKQGNETKPAKLVLRRTIIVPRIMVEAETGVRTVRLVWKSKRSWEAIDVPRKVIASKQRIVDYLADLTGIDINTGNAGDVVQYLSDFEQLCNVPEKKITRHYGWTYDMEAEETKFSSGSASDPYEVITGEQLQLRKAIRCSGDQERQIAFLRKVRSLKRPELKLAILASLASILLEYTDQADGLALHFHGQSDTGKTILLALAASMWGNPSGYVRNFDSTANGLEGVAGLLHNLPLVLDESTTADGKTEGIIYRIYNGKGKTRMNKDAKTKDQAIWKLALISAGEHRLTEEADNRGAINRVLNVPTGSAFIGKEEADSIRQEVYSGDYGHIGHLFADAVQKEGKANCVKLFNQYSSSMDEDNTSKQINAAAVLLAADDIADRYIFKDNNRITPEEIQKFLLKKSDIADTQSAYDYLIDRLNEEVGKTVPGVFGRDTYSFGRITDSNITGTRTYAVYQSKFTEILRERRYDPLMLLEWLAGKNLVKLPTGKKPEQLRTASDYRTSVSIGKTKMKVIQIHVFNSGQDE